MEFHTISNLLFLSFLNNFSIIERHACSKNRRIKIHETPARIYSHFRIREEEEFGNILLRIFVESFLLSLAREIGRFQVTESADGDDGVRRNGWLNYTKVPLTDRVGHAEPWQTSFPPSEDQFHAPAERWSSREALQKSISLEKYNFAIINNNKFSLQISTRKKYSREFYPLRRAPSPREEVTGRWEFERKSRLMRGRKLDDESRIESEKVRDGRSAYKKKQNGRLWRRTRNGGCNCFSIIIKWCTATR